MAQSIDFTQAQKNFKEIYGDDFLKACPEERSLYDTFKFEADDAPGAAYKVGMRMTEEQGFSFRKGTSSAGDNPMNNPIALKVEAAQFLGDILEFRSRIDVNVFAQGMTSKRAFKETVGLRQEAQRDSMVKHTEWSLLNGGRPVGIITAIAAGATAVRKLVTITAASWAGGFWAASENMPLDIYDATSIARSTTAVKRLTSSTSVDAYYKVISYNLDSRVLEIEAPTAGDWTGVVVGDALWRDSSYLNESLGLLELTATQTGVVNGIDASAYGLWRGIVDSNGGLLTVARVLGMAARVATRSSARSKMTFRCSPYQFNTFNTELSALRKYDGLYNRKAQQGFAMIEFYSPNGLIEVVPHTFMPDSVAHLNDDSAVTRRGVSDIDFTMPGGSNEMYLITPNNNQVEYRAYSQQGLFHVKPARSGLFTGLTIPA